jgi:hypothetical protein
VGANIQAVHFISPPKPADITAVAAGTQFVVFAPQRRSLLLRVEFTYYGGRNSEFVG